MTKIILETASAYQQSENYSFKFVNELSHGIMWL